MKTKNLLIISLVILLSLFTKNLNAQDTPPVGAPVIEITLLEPTDISFRFRASADNTPVWIETAPNVYEKTTIGTTTSEWLSYTSTGTTMRFYGDMIYFETGRKTGDTTFASGNAKVSGIDVTGNTLLKVLFCNGESSDAPGSIQELNLSENSLLETLYCKFNLLTTLNLDNNPVLREIYLQNNQIETLNLDNNPNLRNCFLGDNKIQEISVSNNTQLRRLSIINNLMGPCELNDLYESLPDRTGTTAGSIVIQGNPSASTSDTSIASAKNWTPSVTGDGSAECPITSDKTTKEAKPSIWQENGVLFVQSADLDNVKQGSHIQIYSLLGGLVYDQPLAAQTTSFFLPSGVYIVKLNDTKSKIIVR